MNGLNSLLTPEPLRSISATTFAGSYKAVGGVLTDSIRLIRFLNDCNVPVTISWDGSTDHEYLPSGGFLLLDVSTNRETSNMLEIVQGTQFYVKGAAGTGSFYISAYYAR